MSATFSGLPNELIARIFSHVLPPGDVETFSLLSKRVYALGLRYRFIEKHQRLKHQFSFLYHLNEDGSSPAAEILKTLLLNPRAALYVDTIMIDDWKSELDGIASSASNRHVPYPADTMRLFERAVKTSAFVPESETGGFMSEIGNGDEEALLALLISLTPNLRTLQLVCVSGQEQRLSRMVRSIAQAPDTTALARLKTVALGWNETDFIDVDFDWVTIFSSLKSVQRIKGWGIGQLDGRSEFHSSLPPRWSNVNSLQFLHSDIDCKRLSGYLQCVGALQNFSYTAASHDGPFDPSQLCTALACATTSLKDLQISSGDGRGSHMGSLSGFNSLTDLSTEYRMLLDYSGESDSDKLLQMLPASIERVTLQHNDRYDIRSLQDQILGMCKLKNDRLPNLKMLEYCIDLDNIGSPRPVQERLDYINDFKKISKLLKSCMEVGVRLQVSQLHNLGMGVSVRKLDMRHL